MVPPASASSLPRGAHNPVTIPSQAPLDALISSHSPITAMTTSLQIFMTCVTVLYTKFAVATGIQAVKTFDAGGRPPEDKNLALAQGRREQTYVSWTNSRVYSLNDHATFSRYEWQVQQNAAAESTLIGRPLDDKWFPPAAAADSYITALVFLATNGPEQTQADFQELQTQTNELVVLAGHPAHQHGPTLLPPTRKITKPSSRADFRELAGDYATQRTTALQLLLTCLTTSADRDPDLQATVRSKTSPAITRRAAGETAHQAIFRYRLVLSALNLRSNTGERLCCPHTWCPGASDHQTLTHIVWMCAAAQRTWRLVHRQWTQRPVSLDIASSIRSSLGSTTPVLARNIRLRLADEYDDTSAHAATQRTAWRIIQAIVPHQLWLHRNAAAFNGADDSVHSITAKIWKTIDTQLSSYAATLRQTSDTYDAGRLLDLLATHLNSDGQLETAANREARLYYDGGARGNPGINGAGSLLLERRRDEAGWHVVW